MSTPPVIWEWSPNGAKGQRWIGMRFVAGTVIGASDEACMDDHD